MTTATLSTWTIDSVHSRVDFSLEYMGFSTYRTSFRTVEGSLAFDPARPEASSVEASIPVSSIDVTNERLMGRLMDADLLGGKDHPTMHFKSTRVEPAGAGHWNVSGDLTVHGVSRPVVLDTRFLGQGKHPFSGKIAAAFRRGDRHRSPRLRRELERRDGHRRRLPRGARHDLAHDHGGAPGLKRAA